jgi:NADH dehydrogenase
MKVFVTGATGFVGQEVVRQARQGGHSLRILARNACAPAVREVVSTSGAEVHAGDVLDARSLQSGAQGMDAVIHLVGIISEVGRSTFANIHTQGTQNVVTAALGSDAKRFIHMSALGTRSGAASRYHRTKWAAEEIVRRSGCDFTIFRPALIYGPKDNFVNLFARIARVSPVLPVMGSSRRVFNRFQSRSWQLLSCEL